MEITDVRVKRLSGKDPLKAMVSVSFDGEFVVHNIRIIETQNGNLMVAMPSRVSPDGTFRDVAHPITREFREKLSDTVLERYRSEA